MSVDLPTILSAAGLVPRSPAELRALLIALVAATNPDYTANLPGSLVEDIASTDVGAITLIDQARVDLINSLTPLGTNDFLLAKLGEVYGVDIGGPTNTSVFVVFSGPPSFVIGKGFLVSDGLYQYALVTGGVIGEDGVTQPLYAIATQQGSWLVQPGVVRQLVTSVPSSIVLTVTNPEAGTPGNVNGETATSYRARVLQAGLAASQGTFRYLRTLLANVPGVQPRLISISRHVNAGYVEIIVGGGDPYEVANAIFQAMPNVYQIEGSVLAVAGITQANPGVVTTFLNHGYAVGDRAVISGANPNNYDGTYAVLAVPSEKTFQLGKAFDSQTFTALSWAGAVATATTLTPHGITPGSAIVVSGCVPAGYNGTFVAGAGTAGSTLKWALPADPGSETTLGEVGAGIALFDTTGLPPWVAGGILTPNPRNIKVTLSDYPDTYEINFISPPQQIVEMTVTWNSISPNIVSPAAVAQAGAAPLAAYVNSIYAGQVMNLFELQRTFQDAVASIIAPELLTRMVFSVSINGIIVPPDSGTGVIDGDPESYFFALASGINIVQG